MNIPEIFLHAVWEKMWWFCTTAIGILIGLVGRFALTRCLTFFTRTKSFPELAAFTKDDQKRIASRGQ